MIDQAIILLRDELQAYVIIHDPAVTVAVDNIGMLETADGTNLADNIVITVVNIEEESALKNQPALKRPFNNKAIYRNPPVHLNLYVLLTCNYNKNYQLALKRLSHIIRFVQSKTSFSSASSIAAGSLDMSETGITDLKFTLELYTLTFEQINHLWGSLGGRQVPFAMYKLRLIALTDLVVQREVPLIEEIETNIKPIAN